jgi:hypothetical protein
VTGSWRKLHNEELHNVFTFQILLYDRIKEDGVGGALSRHRGCEKCVQNLSWKVSRTETTHTA